MLVLSTGRLCSLNLCFRRRLVSPLSSRIFENVIDKGTKGSLNFASNSFFSAKKYLQSSHIKLRALLCYCDFGAYRALESGS